MGKKHSRPDAHIESERDRLITMVMTAIATGLGGADDKREAAVEAIQSVEAEKNHSKKRVLWKKIAAILALDEVKLFFEDLGTSLAEVVEVLEGKKTLDAAVVKKIQQATKAWVNLGRIGE
jgi:hypothetical protein